MKLQTRQDFEALMLQMLRPLEPMYSPGGALLHLGGYRRYLSAPYH